jgi:hypothetical protein
MKRHLEIREHSVLSRVEKVVVHDELIERRCRHKGKGLTTNVNRALTHIKQVVLRHLNCIKKQRGCNIRGAYSLILHVEGGEEKGIERISDGPEIIAGEMDVQYKAVTRHETCTSNWRRGGVNDWVISVKHRAESKRVSIRVDRKRQQNPYQQQKARLRHYTLLGFRGAPTIVDGIGY